MLHALLLNITSLLFVLTCLSYIFLNLWLSLILFSPWEMKLLYLYLADTLCGKQFVLADIH